jgi:phosphoglycerate kinase
MRTVRDIQVLENIPVLLRTSLNVPVANGKVVNSFRLHKALPTIEFLQKKGARVVLLGHIGEKGTETLAPVYEAMKASIPAIEFCPVTVGKQAREAVRSLPPGGVLMLENLRRNTGEVLNDKKFAKELADLGDVFVEDSFDVCHRAHASVVGVPAILPAYAGLLVEEEVVQLSKALTPKHPAIAIIGGAKFSTKEPVIKKLLEEYDRVFVGGALGNDFTKAMGYSVGSSLVSGADPKTIKNLLGNKKLAVPIDAIVAAVNSEVGTSHSVALGSIQEHEAILDDGPKTVAMLEKLVSGAKTVLWNGPLGNYEHGYVEATRALALAIAKSGAHSILGGGDTEAAIEDLNIRNNVSFISTGGGAMLDFLAKGTLPGLQALEQKF